MRILSALAMLLLLSSPIEAGTFTYFGRACNITDNDATGASGPGPVTITPPASMATNDLVLIFAHHKAGAAAETLSISNNGGQAFSSFLEIADGSTAYGQAFYAVFDGTWDASPTVSATAGTGALTACMIVFRPDAGATVELDVTQVATAYDASAAAKVVTGVTVVAGAVAVAFIGSTDDNQYAISGTNWIVPGAVNQVRNLAGSDTSQAAAYLIKPGAGGTGDVTFTQTGGPGIDTALATIFAFKATGGGTVRPSLLLTGAGGHP